MYGSNVSTESQNIKKAFLGQRPRNAFDLLHFSILDSAVVLVSHRLHYLEFLDLEWGSIHVFLSQIELLEDRLFWLTRPPGSY